ncbi:unnamed protein product, partial [Prorocentrum cordatum]
MPVQATKTYTDAVDYIGAAADAATIDRSDQICDRVLVTEVEGMIFNYLKKEGGGAIKLAASIVAQAAKLDKLKIKGSEAATVHPLLHERIESAR